MSLSPDARRSVPEDSIAIPADEAALQRPTFRSFALPHLAPRRSCQMASSQVETFQNYHMCCHQTAHIVINVLRQMFLKILR